MRGNERYREVGAQVAVDEFLQARWPGYQDKLDWLVPGGIDRAVDDAPSWFERDLPAQLDWSFGEREAGSIMQPALSVLVGDSDALWSRSSETHRLLQEWLLHSEGFILPGTTHFLQMQYPQGMAAGLLDFVRRHPMKN